MKVSGHSGNTVAIMFNTASILESNVANTASSN